MCKHFDWEIFQGLGFFNVQDLDSECPVWFKTSPNTARNLSSNILMSLIPVGRLKWFLFMSLVIREH